ncbi:MAG: DUF4012 domain-containing protein [Acidimicrobiia bacterium]|nr:DUF4012 domain-containing protein [Acidimicrobiia bacterium]
MDRTETEARDGAEAAGIGPDPVPVVEIDDVSGVAPDSRVGTGRHRQEHVRGARNGRRRVLRYLLIGGAAAVLLLIGSCVWSALRIRASLQSAQREADSAVGKMTRLLDPAVDPAEIDRDVQAAASDVRTARSELSRSPGLRVARFVPWIGPNVRALDDITDLADAATAASAKALDGFAQVKAASAGRYVTLADGQVQLADLSPLVEALSHANETLNGVSDRAARLSRPPPGPLRSLTRDVSDDFSTLAESVRTVRAGLTLLPSALGFEGPRTYLLEARNNAELRADGGMVLSIATLHLDAGRVSFTPPVTVTQLNPRPDVELAVDVPDWYRYGFERYGNYRLIQNHNLTAHFPTAADVTAQVYRATTGQEVDGVIALDPVALKTVLAITGPVDAAGNSLSAKTIVPFAVNEVYGLEGDHSERREVIAEVTTAILEKLLAGGFEEQKVARALGKATAQSHIQVWMSRPEEQALVHDLHADGDYAPSNGDYLRVAVQNFGANKLDYFLTRAVRHEVSLREDGSARVRTSITVTNETAAGQPEYVTGTAFADAGFLPGDHQAYVGIYVPRGSLLRSWESPGSQPVSLQEGSRLSYSTLVRVNAGSSVTVDFEYDIPHFEADWRETGRFDVVMQPQGTVQPDTVELEVTAPRGWTVEGETPFTTGFELKSTTMLGLGVERD